MGGDLTASLLVNIRRSTGKILKYEEALRKTATTVEETAEIERVIRELKGISLLNRGKLAGEILDEATLNKIKEFLIQNKVELQIGSAEGIFNVDGYFYPSGEIVEMSPKNAAMFITDGVKMKMVLRENATTLEFIHEFMHFKHCKSIGIKPYYNLKGVEGLINRERYVFDKLMENRNYLTRKELIASKDYMNEYYYDYGITDNIGNPINVNFDFDINNIPKKRQAINIDKFLNKKNDNKRTSNRNCKKIPQRT